MKTTIDANANTVWHFQKSELVALLAHMSTDETRPSYWGLALEAAKGRVWATDGHRIAVVVTGDRTEADRAVSFLGLVPRDFLESVVKIARRDEEISFVCANSRVTSTVAGKILEGRIVNVDPPRIDQVIPHIGSKHTGRSAGFCGDYLGDVALVSNACPPTVTDSGVGRRKKKEKRYPHVLMCPPVGEYDPVVFKVACSANQTDWTVVLMPVRQ